MKATFVPITAGEPIAKNDNGGPTGPPLHCRHINPREEADETLSRADRRRPVGKPADRLRFKQAVQFLRDATVIGIDPGPLGRGQQA